MVFEARPSWDWRRLRLLAALVLGGTLAVVAPVFVPAWLDALLTREVVRGATDAFLWALLAAFLTTLAAAPVGLVVAAWRVRRARRRRQSWLGAARALVLCASGLMGAGLLEVAAGAWGSWYHQIPKLPTAFANAISPGAEVDPPAPTSFAKAGSDALDIVVVGESSAGGVPYQNWLSVGQILGWQLGRVFPGRAVRVDVRAAPGVPLEEAVKRLRGLERRPDAVLIYAGHNEFQGHFGWGRAVAHYPEEQWPRLRGDWLLEAVSRRSALGALVRESLDRNQLDNPPPVLQVRGVVDHPVCTPEEYARLRSDFRRRLEALVTYCETIGALPLLIIPPGNLGDFAPVRSVMAPTATKAERAAFARAFLAARALEASDPARAEGAYRALLDRQPGFAELHYRLARLLERAGDRTGARRHFVLARDLDGLPMRCPSDFQEVYRAIAERHGAVLVDGPEVLAALSPRGVTDDRLFHDAQHPNLRGYAALAQALLDKLCERRAFGWPAGRPAPVVSPAECARHFGMDAPKWATVCARGASFYERTAPARYDRSENLERARRYHEAARRIAAGASVEEAGLMSLDDCAVRK
jgi:hypothetical protein